MHDPRSAVDPRGAAGLFEVAGWSGAGLDRILERSDLPIASRPGEAAAMGDRRTLRLTARTAWLLVRPGDRPEVDLGADGVLVDLSSSRHRLHLREPSLLPRLAAVDPATVGAFAATTIRGIAVVILRVPDGIELLVPASFAHSLTAWIDRAA